MMRPKNQFWFKEFQIVAILIMIIICVVFSEETVGQKITSSSRRPLNTKLGYQQIIKSYSNNRNEKVGRTLLRRPSVNSVKRSQINRQQKWKKPSSSLSPYTLSKKKGLVKPRHLSLKTGDPNLKYSKQRKPSFGRGLKRLRGTSSSRTRNPTQNNRIVKRKLGPSSSSSPVPSFKRPNIKYRPIKNKVIGQSRSGSLRNPSYSSLSNSGATDSGSNRRQLFETDKRVKRKLDVINEWINRIKDSTRNHQHHSMSPSYTTESRITTIPVSSLPLQNERVDNFQRKGPKLFQPTPKHQQKQKRFNNAAKSFTRNGSPNRNQARPKKGKKKQTGLWPGKLNFGFLNKNNNNNKKYKRPSIKNQKSTLAPKQPSGLSKPYLEPPRVGVTMNKPNSKRLSPSSALAKKQVSSKFFI